MLEVRKNMMFGSRMWRRTWVLLIAGLIAAGVPSFARAQDDTDTDDTTDKSAAVPVIIVNAASIDRLLGDVKYLFEVAGQAGINESIDSGLSGINDLKGVDRTKPLGMMIFLAPGFPPRPIPVGYVPVASVKELTETIGGREGAQLKPVDGEENRYELVGQRGTQQVVLRGGYAFISSDAANLDQKFLDPAKLTGGLSSRHDLAVTLRLNTVPDAVKTTLLGVLKAQFNANMQQRDDEPNGPYQLRRANEANTIESIEILLTECDQITLGVNASRENKDAIIEFQFDAKADSKTAEALSKIDSKPTYFAPLLDVKSPLSFSLSWKMDPREQDNLAEFLRILEPQLTSQLEPVAPAVRSLFAALNKTADTGHADAFFQFKSIPPERVALIGGLKVADGQKISVAARSILAQLKQNPEVGEMELDVDSYKGVSFHRIGSRSDAVSPLNQRVFGGQPSLYIGFGSDVLWFAVGDSSALDAAKTAVDELATARATVGNRKRGAPFQFVLNMSQWLDKMDASRPFAQRVRDAFSGGADRLQVDIRPIDNGMRFRLRVEEGYLKLLGGAIGSGIQQGRERREEFRRRRELRQSQDSPRTDP
jgi:hypothetical protein